MVKWSNPGKGVTPPTHIHTHLGVVAIKKGAFWSPLTTAANFTYFLICFGDVCHFCWNKVYNFYTPCPRDWTHDCLVSFNKETDKLIKIFLNVQTAEQEQPTP